LSKRTYESGVEFELDALIYGEINPAILDLRAKLVTSNRKILKRIFKKVQSKESLVPFAVSMFAHLSLPQTLLISGAVIALSAAVDTYFEKREIRESNGLSFLLNFQ